ncbi:MAG: type pilus assembly protein PilC [Patescibacteria group bacterium]|jgi:type IV pilus assembly protein PilC|nr:type pilus assembly protein PilC [Patescibacteria group bacterium]
MENGKSRKRGLRMITFQYTAKKSDGTTVHGLVEAETESAAGRLIIAQGLAPLKVSIKEEGNSLLRTLTSRISTKDKILFSRQLSTLINAGLPLTQSLRTVGEQTGNKKFATVINQVIASVEGGVSFSESLSKHPKIFNAVYIALIAAGETSGTLDKALERIANQQEKDADMISKVRGALVYPAIVVFVIGGVVTFLLTTVVPQIELIYKDFDKELPFLTSILIWCGKFLINFWWLILIVLGAAVFFISRWFKTDSGIAFADKFKLKVPMFGDLFRKLYMARFCRTGQTLMASGVPMLEMLRITSKAVDNVHVENAIARAAQKVKGGKPLSASLKAEAVFLPLVPQMLKVGEQSGAMDQMMDKAATYYENELDNKIKAISTTIEPVLMILLAVVVGGIVMSILVPVYGLASENIAQ